MRRHDATDLPDDSFLPDDSWSLTRSGFDEESRDGDGSLFAVSNGHLGWRATLDEGDPSGTAGVYLNGFFEQYEMPYAEEGFGYPEHGQTVLDAPDGRIIRLLADDEPLDLRTGTVHEHERRLDFRRGTLERRTEWTSPAGARIRVESTRLVSLALRSVAAIRYRVSAVDATVRITLQSEIVANGHPSPHSPNPAISAALDTALAPRLHTHDDAHATLVHRTRSSALTVAVTMRHEVEGPSGTGSSMEMAPDLARETVTTVLRPGDPLTVVKFVGHDFGADPSPERARDAAEAAAADAAHVGWDGLLEKQRELLDAFWDGADVEIGDPVLQQSVRFALFQLFQATARAEDRPVPGKGLTGRGYDGHAFWDDDAFIVPVLGYIAPHCAKSSLLWRHSTLDHARARAKQLSLAGASFPWRTIDGREASGYWPAATAAFHVNADIAVAIAHYVRTTGDREFERKIAVELLVETARLWMALGHYTDDGRFHLAGLTGPDEYSAVADDNVYTNVMAQLNLEEAARVAHEHPGAAGTLGVDETEIESWLRAAEAMTILYDERLGVHPQAFGFTEQAPWDFEAMTPDSYPLQANFHYVELYRKQVVKQADLVLALYFRSELFTPEQKARDFAYYEAITVRDSSLSSAAQAVLAAEVGHLDLALDYVREAAHIDLDDLQGDTGQGLHLASLAGVWTSLVGGFGGMRHTRDGLSFAPRLPPGTDHLRFRLRVRDATLLVEVGADAASYSLLDGERCEFTHFGEAVVVTAGNPVQLDIPALPPVGDPPRQPRLREPRV
ncbi:glycoside hydrolase family 65 protein [Herbiconiux sp. L3-i23]|uniref:glycoside hydrolase family 65 protein n=1 Tax=Herbiconiux sp. L3-i23 TaxID=2905871 RepID=UPI0020511248|nr:glycosyl hydrolase family 65 protein [Herbiconiux sp. L3-i23]BDI23415.1 glycosyl hydrolase [Herbiconiux sp. L3-i23]